ncbi:MAG TPA: diaminopimelate decarboxylase [Fimbriimonadaceae bacterium]|nr:diaminopimelate decarboxylase [Fimbriimonadaceae bacterium]
MSEPGRDTRLILSDVKVRELAALFGTPLYVLDEGHFRTRIRRYREAFRQAWPECEVTFASKANSTLAVLAIAYEEGCLIDAASEGELRAAIAAGVPTHRCHLHGNNKSFAELEFAFEVGVGQIVVDHFVEIEQIFELQQTYHRCPDLVLRLAPGVDPVTHEKIATGQADTKFGFNIANGAADRAVGVMLGLNLPLVGFHCHIGSQLLDSEAHYAAAEVVAEFAIGQWRRDRFMARVLNLGGGLGVRYLDTDEPPAVEDHCRRLVDGVVEGLGGFNLQPKLVQEPGRALIAESGVTLYRIGAIKTVPIGDGKSRTYLAVDGGLSDNARPALYDAKYSVRGIPADAREEGGEVPVFDDLAPVLDRFTVAGKHCETDTLFADVLLPHDLQVGDYLQVLCTGAYNSSMASNYNRFPRPATVLILEDGTPELVQRRDTWDEMFAREILPQRENR